MALGALIGAYQEDDSGGLRALLPLAGRTLIEYQARCAAAAGAVPIVILVERIPPALQQAFERLRAEGVSVVDVGSGEEAATRFEPGSAILLVGDGVVPPVDQVALLTEESEPTIVTVPDDDDHADFERIDAASRWAGLALVDSRTLGSTVAMLGDWDLQSTLLRRAIQDGARRLAVASGQPAPLLVERSEQLAGFEKGFFSASRGNRHDWASRFILAPVEDFATQRLSESHVRPSLLIWSALLLTVVAGFAFFRGYPWMGVACMVLAAPLDQIARRLARLRLRPLPVRMMARRLLWPAALLPLGGIAAWLYRIGEGWGPLMAAAAGAAFAEAMRLERLHGDYPGRVWLFSRRNAIVGSLPFALLGAWPAYLVAAAIYAAGSFFFVQHLSNRTQDELTRR